MITNHYSGAVEKLKMITNYQNAAFEVIFSIFIVCCLVAEFYPKILHYHLRVLELLQIINHSHSVTSEVSQTISDYPSGASEVSRSITDCVTRVSDVLDLILRLIVAIIAPRDDRMASAVGPAHR